jgi:hypothetical protein
MFFQAGGLPQLLTVVESRPEERHHRIKIKIDLTAAGVTPGATPAGVGF